MKPYKISLGAIWLGSGRCCFTVWAPRAEKADVHIVYPDERVIPMIASGNGYYSVQADNVSPLSRYFYKMDDSIERPDPASRFQPDGVHGASAIVTRNFGWSDHDWAGIPLSQYIIYELHVGTFSANGDFDGVIPRISGLKELGITAIELMPIAQFPGNRNWGYDGVYPFAAQNSYGGAEGLKRLVNACHNKGMAVILDVVYNHLGPEGNYFGDFGHYFSESYQTPWGLPINFDGAYSDEVRRYFIENALYWITECHIDALRLDAVHAIYDFSAYPFLEELGQVVRDCALQSDRHIHAIAESASNDPRLVNPRELGGFALNAQWNDDFHHALHCLLTSENTGYYEDFGSLTDFAKALREGFVYSGQYSSYRKRRHGRCSRDIHGQCFVVCAQNHDQIGNRMKGDRLTALTSFEGLKLAAGMLILSPYIPLLFMGEEYGETAPFPYFISHSDTKLIEAVREGRKREFQGFAYQGEPPDPQDENTFLSAGLNPDLRFQNRNRKLYDFYKELIRMRTEIPAFSVLNKENMEVRESETDRMLIIRRWHENTEVLIAASFSPEQTDCTLEFPRGAWKQRICSADAVWDGPGSNIPMLVEDEKIAISLTPQSFTVWIRIF